MKMKKAISKKPEMTMKVMKKKAAENEEASISMAM
jgi:hypothetical protein